MPFAFEPDKHSGYLHGDLQLVIYFSEVLPAGPRMPLWPRPPWGWYRSPLLPSAIPIGLQGAGAVGRIRLVFPPQAFLGLSPWRLEDLPPVHPAICPGEAFLAGDFCVPVMGSVIPLLIFPGPQMTF